METKLNCGLISLLTVVKTVISKSPASFCPMPGSEYYDKENDETIQEFFECPGPEDPKDYTRCCNERCCTLKHVDSVMGLDINIAIALSLSVIFICLILGIVIVVCCFWSPCPMYDTCGGGYKRREGTVPFGDLDCTDTDPLTSNGSSSRYYTSASINTHTHHKPDHV